MEKISFQATYTRISVYASSASGAGKPVDKAGTGDVPDPSGGGKECHGPAQKGSARTCQFSKDGDTFTLSIEARSIRISGTTIIDDSGKALSGPDRNVKDARNLPSETSAWNGKDAEILGAEYLEGMGLPSDARLVNAFLDAMRKSGGEEGYGRQGRRHHFPRLGDSEDLADRLMEHLGRQHAEKGGSRAEMADDARRRLQGWETSASKVAMEYREFRGEARMKMDFGLDAWVASGSVTAERDPAA